jgi:hypothetical protein
MTKQQIADQLKALSVQMINIGTAMDYYGGLNSHVARHGAELVDAGLIAESWAANIESEIKEQS